DTKKEIGFGAIWRASGGGRRWVVTGHCRPQRDGPMYSLRLAVAMRRSDGFIASSRADWLQANTHRDLGTKFFVAPIGVASPPDLEVIPRRQPSAEQPH